MTAWTVNTTTTTVRVLLLRGQRLQFQANIDVFPALQGGVVDVLTYGWQTLTMKLFARCQGSWRGVFLVGRPLDIQPVLLEGV